MNLIEKFLGPVGELPRHQLNALLEDTPRMHIGIPHKGGHLAVHAEKMQYAGMVSASAFYDASAGKFRVPEATPLHELPAWALDSAGFTAVQNWSRKGTQPGMAGVYPWTYSDYLTLAAEMRPTWASQPDLCCEPEATGSDEEVDFRIRATGTLLFGCLQVLYDWQEQLCKDTPACVVQDMLRPVVPVIQGWTRTQYLRSLELMLEVWGYWEPWVAPPALIGIGSVCRRDVHHPEHGLLAILTALERHLPKGMKVHLFGVKGAAIEYVRMFDFVASYDSMAWDFSARKKAHQQGISNNMMHRSNEMTRWMDIATSKMAPKVGDQFRLSF
ncbi:hypothetical protein [Burkholderia sp. Ac-20365]|uniref:deazapurine DNA modification protein DpdA family protein n=1 Tax=Burkholderia sp. Ac-20365 TaxID=2703897 RepID=UPI00197C7CD0|nr:hypothetical protein [Burkholderia sp. Ac-20365]MBN3761315.1 hypothetical protein [Burkholderia sp. Ac-20365]